MVDCGLFSDIHHPKILFTLFNISSLPKTQNLTYGYHGFEAAIVQAFNSRTSILPPSLNRHTPTSPGA